ncbi:MAG TPA: TRAM domain-containing protein [Chthoniobacterales bacterium]|nr:TRAM domain-containing protein [Chthoniobacterales bacterium]
MTSVTELQIQDVAFGGKGVARIDGKAVFVPYVIDGESVSASVTREHKKFFEAELENVIAPSPHRVEPRCPYFGRCGGCAYQHIEYEHQLALKWRQVKETLRRIGGLREPPMRPFIPAPIEYGYRNRITVHVRDGVIGFFRRESNKLIAIEHCPIARGEVNAKLTELSASHPHDGHYTLRVIDGPRVFIQANDEVAAAMLDLVDRLIAPAGGTLIDAYSGAGFFAKRLRARFERVIGIDWDQRAIAVARKDANENETYVAADVETELGATLRSIAAGADDGNSVVIVDPPATGLSKMIVETLIEHQPTQLIYVSCNPATLARDLVALKKSFRVDSITPLDMFPQTAEIEVTVKLTARGQ